MSFFKPKGTFIENLPRIYGLYTGGFLVFVLLMAGLEQMGVSADTIGILFVSFTITKDSNNQQLLTVTFCHIGF